MNRAFAGDEVLLRITVTNRKPIPLAWVRLMDSVPEGLELVEHPLEWDPKLLVQNLVHRVSLGAYERVRWTYRLRCTRRGLFRLGPASLRTGDIFGFFPRQRPLTEQHFILVYPRTVPLPDVGLPARWPVGDRRGARRLYQDPARPAGVRDYLPGDPVKHIDWKATARRGALQVKVFEPGASILAVPVVNVDTIGLPYGGAIPHHLERVLTTAASLTEEALGHGLNVGLITNGKSALYDHPMSVAPGRSRQQLDMVYEALAMVTPYVGSRIEEQLLMAARRLPPGVTLVLITAILTTELAAVPPAPPARKARPPGAVGGGTSSRRGCPWAFRGGTWPPTSRHWKRRRSMAALADRAVRVALLVVESAWIFLVLSVIGAGRWGRWPSPVLARRPHPSWHRPRRAAVDGGPAPARSLDPQRGPLDVRGRGLRHDSGPRGRRPVAAQPRARQRDERRAQPHPARPRGNAAALVARPVAGRPDRPRRDPGPGVPVGHGRPHRRGAVPGGDGRERAGDSPGPSSSSPPPWEAWPCRTSKRVPSRLRGPGCSRL